MAKAILRDLRMGPLKVRRVARIVSGKRVDEAQNILALDTHAVAPVLAKVIKSAAANAVNNEGANEDLLFIRTIMVDKSKVLRRYLPRSRGRADQIKKRMSHITVVVEEQEQARRAKS
ncbi:MAG TPA: 50S ribosomal protein L22 [Abditibacteriaceae bacterium]|nr:50S ribosomal protein L22 [Abditibacteriaceae bacterium]